MKYYLSILITVICLISCDNVEEDNLTSDNTFSLDNVKYETPHCFVEDWGIEAGNRDLREYTILLASDEHDGDPFVLENPNTHALTFVLFSPSLTELASGEYILTTATDYTLCSKEWKPGYYLGTSVGTKLKENQKDIMYCPGGKITVKKLANHEYYFSYSSTCDNGKSLKGSFKGSITMLDYIKWGCWDE